jgi:threonylcarbamoyladenosine tRNA methylthiotransferase MtaB
MSNRKVAFHTLGCKLNFSETSTIARSFENSGYQRVDFKEKADVYVINTCSVTENADRECKQIVRSALNISPDAFIAVVGCYAQLKPNDISAIDGVDLVLGATEKFNILNYLDDLGKRPEQVVHSCEIEEADFFVGAYSFGDRTRTFLKVQDGCDYPCTYCTIPLARGKSRSDSIENVVKNAYEIAKLGVKEIVLTGVNIGDFGKKNQQPTTNLSTKASAKVDNPQPTTFLDLIKELDGVEGIERFRISSIEPNLLKDEIIEFVAKSKRFVPHFHIPLQSGSNKILKAMRRRYLRELYVERVAKIKSLMPHCCIGVDVIVGFPGETNEDFLETYDFINQLDVSYLHVFTYSERDNTEALKIKEVVPIAERKKRNKMLRILSAKKLRSFYEANIGTTRQVLFETENKNGYLHGFTDNYIKVKTSYDPLLVNKLTQITISEISTDGIFSIKEVDTVVPAL